MNTNEYLEYIDYFNSQQYDNYYTDDIVVQLPAKKLEGKQAVKDFYTEVNRYVHETIRVKKVFMDNNDLVANIWSDFYCHKDWKDFIVCPVTTGQMVRVELVVLYTMQDNKFSHIRAGRLTGPIVKTKTGE